jgi:hypothetical protein
MRRMIKMGTEKTIHDCLAPEAYMRLWNSVSKNNAGPRYASTVFVKKKIDSPRQNNNVDSRSVKKTGLH